MIHNPYDRYYIYGLPLVILHGHAEPYNTLYCNTANTNSYIRIVKM